MTMKNSLKLSGNVKYVLRDKNGNVKDKREYKNLIVDAGLEAMAGLLASDVSENSFDAIAIGTDNTSPTSSDTALGTETDRISGSSVTGSKITNNVSNDTAKFEGTFTFSSSKGIVEAGLFNDSSSGTMLARQTFSTINVTSSDSLKVTWEITFS